MKRIILVDRTGYPKCDQEALLQKAAFMFNEMVIEDDAAVDEIVNNLFRLKRVCNHNTRGEKINFRYEKLPGWITIYTGVEDHPEGWTIVVRFHWLTDPMSVLDVNQIIEQAIHSEDLNMFDKYLAEKELEKEEGYEGL